MSQVNVKPLMVLSYVQKPSVEGASLVSETPLSGRHRGWGTGDGRSVDSRGIQPTGSFSAPEEIERFAHWWGTIGQCQTVQMTAIFEILRDALPAQAHVMSFGRPVGFD